MVVTTDFEVWVGNESTSEIALKNCDIFGFHAGDFDVKMVSGVLSHYPASFKVYNIKWYICTSRFLHVFALESISCI